METGGQSFPKEYKFPGILLLCGLGIIGAYGIFVAGPAVLVPLSIALPILIAKNVLPGLLAGIVLAKFLGADFGDPKTAVLKFTAIIFFSLALTFFITGIGFIVQAMLWVGLIIWLFEMTPGEAVALTITAVVVNFVLQFLWGMTQMLQPRSF